MTQDMSTGHTWEKGSRLARDASVERHGRPCFRRQLPQSEYDVVRATSQSWLGLSAVAAVLPWKVEEGSCTVQRRLSEFRPFNPIRAMKIDKVSA